MSQDCEIIDIDSLNAQIEFYKAENKELRRMLCVQYSGIHAYMDDGEAQDNGERPFIDFMQDSPETIRQKFIERCKL